MTDLQMQFLRIWPGIDVPEIQCRSLTQKCTFLKQSSKDTGSAAWCILHYC